MTGKILQIIPIERGWRVRYNLKAETDKDDDFVDEPLAALALVEGEDGETRIRAVESVDQYFDLIDESNQFVEYRRPNQDCSSDSAWPYAAPKKPNPQAGDI